MEFVQSIRADIFHQRHWSVEVSPNRVVLVMENEVYDFSDRASFVRCAIYIVYWDWLGYFNQVELAVLHSLCQ